MPALARATDVAFMDGLGPACALIGVLCLLGAAAALLALPGRHHAPAGDDHANDVVPADR